MKTHNIIMNGYLFRSNSKNQQIIELLCATAKKGLANCYSKSNFFGQRPSSNNHNAYLNMALNLRYIIIAQIGIKKWLRFHNSNDESLPDFWEYICSKSYEVDSAGDLGLAIWAGIESDINDCRAFAGKLANNWAYLRRACNAVELAWVVQGMTHFSQSKLMTNAMTDVLKDAHDMLTSLYCQDTRLFARHTRRGLKEVISGRIACFADQVYPIMALANYGRTFGEGKSIDVAAAVTEKICKLQGDKGQWWWQYDVETGTVAEEYPVFSVHQDGMAPMALRTIDKITGTNHGYYIEKGLMWLNERNERNEMMVVPEKGIIWRDIHRREISKMYRLARSVLVSIGLNKAHRLAGKNLFGYAVNRECRPYHLGWILYAWANYL